MTDAYNTMQKISHEHLANLSQAKPLPNSPEILGSSLVLKSLQNLMSQASILSLIRNQVKICRMFLYCQRVVIIDVCCISNIQYRSQQTYLMQDNQTNINKREKFSINKKPEKIHEECKKNFQQLYQILKNFKTQIQSSINTKYFTYYQYMLRVFDKTVKKYLYSIREQTQKQIQRGDTQLLNKSLFLDNILKIHEDFIAVFKYKSNNELMDYSFGSVNKEKQVNLGLQSKYKNEKMKGHSKNYVIDTFKKILNSRLIIDQYHKLFKSYHQKGNNELNGQKFPKQMSKEQIKLRKKIKKTKWMLNKQNNINVMIKLFSQSQQNRNIYKYMNKNAVDQMIQNMQQAYQNLTYSFCSSNCWNCIQCFHKNVQILPESNFHVPPPTKILSKLHHSQNLISLSKLIKSPQKPYTIKTITEQEIQNKLILSSKICQIFNHGCGYLYIGIKTISKSQYKYDDGRIHDRYMENEVNSMKSQNSPSSNLQNSYIYIPTGIDITSTQKEQYKYYEQNIFIEKHKKEIIRICGQSVSQNLQPEKINQTTISTIFDIKNQQFLQISYIPVLQLSTTKTQANTTKISKPIKNRYIIKIFINLHFLKTQQIFYLKPKNKTTKILQNLIFASEEQYLYDSNGCRNGLNYGYMNEKQTNQDKQDKQLLKYWDVIKDKLLGQNNYQFILNNYRKQKKWMKKLTNSSQPSSQNQNQPPQQFQYPQSSDDSIQQPKTKYKYIKKYIFTKQNKEQINNYIKNCKHYPIKCYQGVKVNINGIGDEENLEDSGDGSLVEVKQGEVGVEDNKEGKSDKSKSKSKSKKYKKQPESQLNKCINEIPNHKPGSKFDIIKNSPPSTHDTSLNSNIHQDYNSYNDGFGQIGYMPGYQYGMSQWQPYVQYPYMHPGIGQGYGQNYMGSMQYGNYQQGYEINNYQIAPNLSQLNKISSKIPQKSTKDFGTFPKSITETPSKHNSLIILSETGIKDGLRDRFKQKLIQLKIQAKDYQIFQELEKYRSADCKRQIIFLTHVQKYEDVNRIACEHIDKQKRHMILTDIRNQFCFQQKNKPYTQILFQLSYQYRNIFLNKIQFGKKQQEIKTNSKINPIKIETTCFLKLNNWIQSCFCFMYLQYQNIRCTFVNNAKLQGIDLIAL